MNIQASFSRPSIATIEDHEGRVLYCKIDEARFEGLRRVENVLTNSVDPSLWSTDGGAVNTGGNTFYLPTTDDSVVRATGLTAEQTNPAYETKGKTYACSIELKASDADQIGKEVDLQIANFGNTIVNVIRSIQLTGEYTRYGVTGTTIVNEWDAGMSVVVATPTAGVSVDIRNPQLEDITGCTNSNPSEYVSIGAKENHGSNVDGVKYFGYLNGNTIEVDNSITPAQGSDITGDAGYLSEWGISNIAGLTEDLDGWLQIYTVTNRDSTTLAPDGSNAWLITTSSDSGNYLRRIAFQPEEMFAAGVEILLNVKVKPSYLENITITLEENGASGDVCNLLMVTDTSLVPGEDNLFTSVVERSDGWLDISMSGITTQSFAQMSIIFGSSFSTLSTNDDLMHVYGITVCEDSSRSRQSYIPNMGISTVVRSADLLSYINVNATENATVILNANIDSGVISATSGRLFSTPYDGYTIEQALRTYINGADAWSISTTNGIAFILMDSEVIDTGFHKYGFRVKFQTIEDPKANHAICFDGEIKYGTNGVPDNEYTDHSLNHIYNVGWWRGDDIMPRQISKYFAVYDLAMTDQELIDATNEAGGTMVMSSINLGE